jgi:hypothetical protein
VIGRRGAGPRVVSLAAAVGLGLAAMVGPAAGVNAAAPTTGAVQDFGACLAARGGGDLLLLIDESGSLRQSDPQNARVTAATYLVDRMAATAASGGFTMDVSVAGFSGGFDPVAGWTRLDGPGLASVKGAITSFTDRRDGLETDYWNAIEGARRSLADRLTTTNELTRCQAVAWFSDGQLDLVPRTSAALQRQAGDEAKAYAPGVDLRTEAGAAAAEAAAKESLCRGGGLADQVRASGVWTFGVGLASGTSKASDFSLMQSIAAGHDDAGTACGALLDRSPGDFVLASNIDDMLFAFDRFGSPQQAPIEQTAGVCQGGVCADAQHRFVLDASIRSVHVLGSADVPGVKAVLIAPDGTQTPLDKGKVGVATDHSRGATTITAAWQSDRTVAVDLGTSGSDTGWPGAWALVFVDASASSPNGVSRSDIYISGDLRPTWTAPSDAPVHIGESVPGFRLGLADTAGTAVDPASLLGTVSASAALVAADGTTTTIAEGLSAAGMASGLVLDLTKASPGEAVIRVELAITTAPATLPDGSTVPGTALAPERVDVPITLRAPADFPTVSPRLDFGTTDGRADLTARLSVTGPGCVWVASGGATLQAFPQEVGDVVVTAPTASSAGTCLKLAKGQTATLPVSLRTTAAGNGSINGSLAVTIAPTGELQRATTVKVPFSADLRKPLDRQVFVLGLVLALILGPGIPIGLLYLIKAVSARIPPRALAAEVIPVTVEDGRVLRSGAPFALRDTDFVELVRLSARGARTVSVSGLTLRTHVGWSPFGPASVLVEAPGQVGASSVYPVPVGRRHQARLPLAVHNTWAVFVGPSAPAEQATLLLLVGADTSQDRRRDMVDDVVTKLPELVRDLRAIAPATGPGSPTPGASTRAADFDPFAPGAYALDRDPVRDPFGFAIGDDEGQR